MWTSHAKLGKNCCSFAGAFTLHPDGCGLHPLQSQPKSSTFIILLSSSADDKLTIFFLKKPTDLDLHFLQRKDLSGFSRTRFKIVVISAFNYANCDDTADFQEMHFLNTVITKAPNNWFIQVDIALQNKINIPFWCKWPYWVDASLNLNSSSHHW